MLYGEDWKTISSELDTFPDVSKSDSNKEINLSNYHYMSFFYDPLQNCRQNYMSYLRNMVTGPWSEDEVV